MEYLRSFYNGRPVQYSYGEPSIAGRPFYNDDFTELNCIVRRDRLDEVLRQIETHLGDQEPPTYYVASLPVDACLPGFSAENDVGLTARGYRYPAQHLDRQSNRCVLSLRCAEQPGVLCDRTATVYRVSAGAGLQPVSRTARADAGRTGRQRGRLFAPGLWQVSAVSRGPCRRADRRGGARRRGLHSEHVVAPRRRTGAVQRTGQLLVEQRPGIHTDTARGALSPDLVVARPARARKESVAPRVRLLRFRPIGPRGAHLPAPARGVLGPIDEGLARQIRARLINKLNR